MYFHPSTVNPTHETLFAMLRMAETLILGLQFHGSRQVRRHGTIKTSIWWIDIWLTWIDVDWCGLIVTFLCVTFENFWNAKPELILSVYCMKPGERRPARWSPTSFGDFLSFLRKHQHVSWCFSLSVRRVMKFWRGERWHDKFTNKPWSWLSTLIHDEETEEMKRTEAPLFAAFRVL